MKNKITALSFASVSAYMKKLVREKASKVDSTIVYLQDGNIIEENPKTRRKKILKKEFSL